MAQSFSGCPVGIGVVSNRVIDQVNDRLCAMTCGGKKDFFGNGL